jgi:hypothetical protein
MLKNCGLSLSPLGTVPASFAAWTQSHEPSWSIKYARDDAKFARDMASNPAAKKMVCAQINSRRSQIVADTIKAWRALQDAHAKGHS